MPCETYGMSRIPSELNARLHLAARAFMAFCRLRGVRPQSWVVENRDNEFASDERLETVLCDNMKMLSGPSRDELLYSDARDPDRRLLADWWESHLEMDEAREKESRAREEREAVRQRALSKLTPEERHALGVSE